MCNSIKPYWNKIKKGIIKNTVQNIHKNHIAFNIMGKPFKSNCKCLLKESKVGKKKKTEVI